MTVIIPKHTGDPDLILQALKIYYDVDGWLPNAQYRAIYKEEYGIINDDKDQSAYTKKGEVAAYFGYLEWRDITNKQSDRRITPRGKLFYEHYISNDRDSIYEDIMCSLEEISFGRNNFGCQSSDSDIEPPALYFRAMIDLGSLSIKEFAYLVDRMDCKGKQYTDTIRELQEIRQSNQTVDLSDVENKFSDAKPFLFLENIGVLSLSGTDGRCINPVFYSRYKERLQKLKIFNIDKFPNDDINENWRKRMKIDIDFNPSVKTDYTKKRNWIVFGAPGTGKSFKLKEESAKLLADHPDNFERVTFFPEYTYSRFVGSYKPVMDDEKKGEIRYEFVPGPFMRIYEKALKSIIDKDPQPFLLIIEELNRANAAAVFGDAFQLLDRDTKGVSDYELHPSNDIKKYLADKFNCSVDSFATIKIPSNMFIWATMNSADQGVCTIDTAFKRRWEFEYLGIDENEDKIKSLGKFNLQKYDSPVSWNSLRKAINAKMTSSPYNVNEDKLMGPFFLSKSLFDANADGSVKDINSLFDAIKSKVIMYLYEDAVKQSKHKFFDGCDSSKFSSVCDAFDKEGMEIFGSDFVETYYNKYKD